MSAPVHRQPVWYDAHGHARRFLTAILCLGARCGGDMGAYATGALRQFAAAPPYEYYVVTARRMIEAPHWTRAFVVRHWPGKGPVLRERSDFGAILDGDVAESGPAGACHHRVLTVTRLGRRASHFWFWDGDSWQMRLLLQRNPRAPLPRRRVREIDPVVWLSNNLSHTHGRRSSASSRYECLRGDCARTRVALCRTTAADARAAFVGPDGRHMLDCPSSVEWPKERFDELPHTRPGNAVGR